MITKKELAKKLNVSTRTIDRNVEKGMPSTKLPTGSIRFDYDDVKLWIESIKKIKKESVK